MIGFFVSTTPLAASGVAASPWYDVSATGGGDLPAVLVAVSTDQAGTVQIFEAENPGTPSMPTLIGGGAVSASLPFSTVAQVRKRFVQVIYTNGATAQTTLNLTAFEFSNAAAMSEARWRDLMLRELRIQTLLLLGVKEPTSTNVNVEPSLDQIET